MKALTIHRPWTDAIAYLPDGKRIENRSWKTPKSVRGRRIAIHAGKTYDPDAAAGIADLTGRQVPGATESPTGVVAVARLAGLVLVDAFGDTRVFPEKGVGAGAIEGIDYRWWTGGDSIGWILSDVVGIPPVPCGGRQGLWNLPPLVERDVLARVEAVRAGELDPRPRHERLAERRAELAGLGSLAFTGRAMGQGFRRWRPTVEALAVQEIDEEMRRELRQLAVKRAERARR